MTKTNEAKITALKAAISSLEASKRTPTYIFNPPWRNVEIDPDTIYDPKEIDKEIDRLEYEIISIELSERDPEQDAEMRMEIEAAIALSGNWDDEARYYMHTPMQEERFQRGIEAMVDHEIRMERGDYDYWSGPCPLCGSLTDSDSHVSIMGYDGCITCAHDVKPLMQLIASLCGFELIDEIEARGAQLRYKTEADYEWEREIAGAA